MQHIHPLDVPWNASLRVPVFTSSQGAIKEEKQEEPKEKRKKKKKRIAVFTSSRWIPERVLHADDKSESSERRMDCIMSFTDEIFIRKMWLFLSSQISQVIIGTIKD